MAVRRAISVSVAWATPKVQDVVSIDVPAGTTVGAAIAASGIALRHAIDLAGTTAAIFGRRVPMRALLRAGDRIDLCRPLPVDPKAKRMRRATASPAPAAKPREKR